MAETEHFLQHKIWTNAFNK